MARPPMLAATAIRCGVVLLALFVSGCGTGEDQQIGGGDGDEAQATTGSSSSTETAVSAVSEPEPTAVTSDLPADTAAPTTEDAAPAPADGDFCEVYAKFLRRWLDDEFGPVQLTEEYRALADVAPAGLTETFSYMADSNEALLRDGDFSNVEGGQAAYDAAGSELQQYATDECGVEL